MRSTPRARAAARRAAGRKLRKRDRSTPCRSAQELGRIRPENVRGPQRQALPQLDEALITRIGRAQIGELARLDQEVLVEQRLRLEAPVMLEIECAGAALAAAVVEDLQAALSRVLHHFPVHEIVAGDGA